MSKAIKGVTRAVGKVVKGAGKVVKGAVEGVGKVAKKVWDNPLGKIALGAAGMFMGVPAIQGMLGGGAAAASGASGLSGAMTNISSAWGGLTGGISGSGLSSASSGGFLEQVATEQAGKGLLGSAASGAATQGATQAATQAASQSAGGGLLSRAMSSPYAVPMAMQVGGGLLSGMGQQRAAQDQREYEESLSEQERSRYNTNVGTPLWG
tara:strand:+ start:5921 stop:6547 length:627 start_codon:yes stop_codon:yes gene_type:complete